MMISWSKLLNSAQVVFTNSLTERSPMDPTYGKVFNSMKIPASLHSVTTSRAPVVTPPKSREPAGSV